MSGKDVGSPHSHTTSRSSISRRTLLASGAAVGATTALGGCLGSEDNRLTVGFALPFTGTYALLGESIVAGFELFIEQQGGEINGREVEFVRRDTEAETSRGVDVTRELLLEARADAIVGPVSSAVAMAMIQPIQTESSAIWFNANAGDYRVTAEGCPEYHFRTSFNDWQTSAPLAEFVYEEVADNVCLAYADYAFGQNSKEFFKEAFEDLGGEVVEEVGAPLGTDDFSPYLGDIQGSGADAVYSFFAGDDAVNYVNAFSDFGLNEEMVQTGSGFMLANDTLPAQGESALGMYSLLHYTTTHDTERNREFVENYVEMYDETPNVYACQGYDSAQAFAGAVEETGGTDPDEMAESLVEMEFDSPRGEFEFDPETHEAIQNLYVREVVEADDGESVENEVVETLEDVEGPDWGCSHR
ncbi:ABC transporter substrate-binding protein [Natronococcus sp. A-GB7]|uniref:ABC transporter substrate-binding protein n=1 Tax=Natronococcus sp. A-GB7 TaxID=3037649 RepID=UPI00241F69AC|nr:ABC transporter substrate-binding protein [Natronococcus sp. A-GB7]MDG5817657.1 ABC transporter substrate-binding protein [Natronococcus sp. A-GB7]